MLFGFFVQSMLPEFPILPSDSLREGVFLLFFATLFPRQLFQQKKGGHSVRNTRLKNKFKKNGSHLLSRIALQYHRRKRA